MCMDRMDVLEEARQFMDIGSSMLNGLASQGVATGPGADGVLHTHPTIAGTSAARGGCDGSKIPARRCRRPNAGVSEGGVSARPIMSFFGAKTAMCETDREATCDHGIGQTPSTPSRRNPQSLSGGTGGDRNDECRHCKSTDIAIHVADSFKCCRQCDAVEYIVVENERPAKRDVPKDSTSFSFKRLSHFNEWLAQIQGRDHPSIPNDAIGFVMVELRRHHVVNAADVSVAQVRNILKKLKMSRYYEHVPYIISRIKGVPSERMPQSLEEELRAMFRKIQLPFVRNSPASRKNFLSYGYVLHKFVQLLGADEYLGKFPLLKSRDKLRVQDAIWKNICSDLNWEYIPSI